MEEKRDSTTAQPRLRWYQFSLRALLIAVTLAGCGLGWLGFKVREAGLQQVAVATLWKHDAWVYYDYEFDSQGHYGTIVGPPGPAWLRALLGDDFFRQVAEVQVVNPLFTDAGLEPLQGLSQIRRLSFPNTQITDAGLEYLKGLTKLETLDLRGTHVSAAGVAKLQKVLPNCRIAR